MLPGEACLAPTTDRAFRVGAQHAAPSHVLKTYPDKERGWGEGQISHNEPTGHVPAVERCLAYRLDCQL